MIKSIKRIYQFINSQQLNKSYYLFLPLLCFATIANAQLKWIKTEASTFSSIALRSDGTIWTWGFNANGQLGIGNIITQVLPTQVGTDTNWVDISVGAFHGIALKSDGTIWTWGLNISGQLGIGSTSIQLTLPVQAGTDTDWESISAGRAHSLAIKKDSSLWVWGMNFDGQLGDGTTTDRRSPIQIGTAHDWLKVSGGGGHTMAIKADGTLWGWGNDGNGQLGHGTNINRTSPAQIGTDTNWAEVSSGNVFSIGLKKDSSLWAWGDNNVGQVGNGIPGNVNSPVHISKNNKFIKISAGSAFSFAIRSDSALFGWGINHVGQLGTGGFTQQSVPFRIGNDNDWLHISASMGEMQNNVVFGFHTVGIKASSTNTICSTGNNNAGQLGNGTTTNRSSISCNTGILVGIDKNSLGLETEVHIYPNPTEGRITLSTVSELYPVELNLKDIQGRLINSKVFTSPQVNFEINGPSGIYFLELKYNDGRIVSKKIIKSPY